MDSRACLEYALFQLTPTRTRCDLVIFAGKEKEKLASGLLEPFLSHLKSAKEELSRGGYSITLRPSTPYSPWFTKATLERFVKFVTTPEVLERFVRIEREIMQIENEQTSVASQVEGEFNGAVDTAPEENPKIRLQHVLETRKAVLRKEQAMAYARALVSGFEVEYLDDLIMFANAFGALRLREACINFLELCNKKSNDGIWLDEVAAMQACTPSEFSYFEKSGITLAGEDPMVNFRNVSTPKSSISRGSSDTHQDNSLPSATQIQAFNGKAQLPTWPHHFPPYPQDFHGPGFQQTPPFLGYNFPSIPVPHSYFPGNMPWPPDVGDSSRSLDHEPDESWQHASLSRSENRKNSRENDRNQNSDTTSGSDTEDYAVHKERHSSKHRKGSSRKVVIRNLNYIASKKYGEGDSSSGDSSSENEDSPKGKVEQAIAAFERSHNIMSHNKKKLDGRKRNSAKNKEGIENDVKGNAENEIVNRGWDIFQNLLLKNADSSPNDAVIDAKVERLSKENGLSNGSFIAIARDFNKEDKFEITEESVCPANRREITDEEFLVSKRIQETNSHSIFDGDYIPTSIGDHATEKNKNDVLVDEPLMVQARPFENLSDSQPKADIFMVSDIVGASQPNHKIPDSIAATTYVNEPDDLCMVLERDLAADQVETSWNPEMDYANNVSLSESLRRQSDVCPIDSVNTNLPQNGKDPNIKSSKGLGGKTARKETYSRTPAGSHARSKAEITSRIKKSPSGSITPKSKAQKEEENRKKMEELALQRQRRIVERSSGTGAKTSTSKKTTKDSKSPVSVKAEKPKLQDLMQVMEKLQKPVCKSSTIDRLAATHRNLKPPAAESKNNLSRKKSHAQGEKNDVAALSLPKKKVVHKVKPLVKSSTNESIMVSTASEVQIKECDIENIKELHSVNVSSVEKNKACAIPHEDPMSEKNNDHIPNRSISVLTTEDESVDSTVKDIVGFSPHTKTEPSPYNPLNSVASEMYISRDTSVKSPFSAQNSPIEISTPPPSDEVKLETLQSRKKWIGDGNSTKISKGIRKFLLIGRKSSVF